MGYDGQLGLFAKNLHPTFFNLLSPAPIQAGRKKLSVSSRLRGKLTVSCSLRVLKSENLKVRIFGTKTLGKILICKSKSNQYL